MFTPSSFFKIQSLVFFLVSSILVLLVFHEIHEILEVKGMIFL